MSWTCPQCGKLFCDTCSGMTSTAPEIHEGFTVQTLGGNTPTCPHCQADASADGMYDEVRQAMREGKKIEAIKLYRERTGMGLKEAKEAIDALWNAAPPGSASARDTSVDE